jgi:rubrerythrin
MKKRLGLMALTALFLATTFAWTGLGQAQYQGEKKPIEAKMLSKTPVKLDKVKKEDLDKQILRASIIAELDAVNLYEQLASMTDNEKIKAVLLDVAKEEKTHAGEFQALLLRLDPEYSKELAHGEKEVEELTGKKK